MLCVSIVSVSPQQVNSSYFSIKSYDVGTMSMRLFFKAAPSTVHVHLNRCTMACPPVRGIVQELSGGQTWYNYFTPPTSAYALHITRYFVLNLVIVV